MSLSAVEATEAILKRDPRLFWSSVIHFSSVFFPFIIFIIFLDKSLIYMV